MRGLRRRVKKLSQPVGFRFAEHILGTAFLFDNPFIEKHYMRRDITRQIHVMRDENHGPPLGGKLADHLDHLLLQLRVKR